MFSLSPFKWRRRETGKKPIKVKISGNGWVCIYSGGNV